jgi:hypothetical protein
METYTHDMLKKYISENKATDEAWNYINAEMTPDEIRADLEDIFKEYIFEIPEDKDTYIDILMRAVEKGYNRR